MTALDDSGGVSSRAREPGPAPVRLDEIRTVPLGQLTAAQVDPVVRRLVRVHADERALDTAKFSSII